MIEINDKIIKEKVREKCLICFYNTDNHYHNDIVFPILNKLERENKNFNFYKIDIINKISYKTYDIRLIPTVIIFNYPTYQRVIGNRLCCDDGYFNIQSMFNDINNGIWK